MTIDSDAGATAESPTQEKVRCFFDVSLGGLPAGRIVFELFPAVAPKTCENFRALCTGEKGIGQKTGKPLHYKGIIFHRVVKDFMIQSGDFSNGNGTGGESIYGGTFDDEEFTLKHDRAFLLSMANRGKNTNGSQFFITTQPAPHLDNVHVVFGHVVSGQDLVRQLEQLPVDRNSRPLQDAMVSNLKKEKKSKKVAASSDEDSSDTSRKRKKDKKKKRGKDSSPRTKRTAEANASGEEGEVEDDIHPMATVTKIDPDEIPEVSNKYLMRSDSSAKLAADGDGEEDDGRKRENRSREQKGFGWSKKRVPLSRSGRTIKGRGHFRYRTPSRSRSRSRSQTPIHWRAAQKRTIKMTDLEKMEEEKRERENEIKRREAERKKRHEELAKGVSKKSFFELNQEQSAPRAKSASESPDAAASKRTAVASAKEQEHASGRAKSNGSIDMNALDYEHNPADGSESEPEEATHKKSDSLAKALGVEPKKKSADHPSKGDDRRKPSDDRKRDRSRSRSRDRYRRGDDYRGRSPPAHYRGGGGGGGGGNRNRPPYGFGGGGGGGPPYNRYNNQQPPNRRYGGGNNVGGSYYSRPWGRFGGNGDRYDRDRSRRSRSHDGGSSRRSRRDRSQSRSRSRSHERHRRRSRDSSGSGSSVERSQRDRSDSPAKRFIPASRTAAGEKRTKTSNGKELEKFRDKSPASVATAIVVAATAAVEASKLPAVVIKKEELSEEEKARMQKEKMLKRAETLLLLKSHMEKEIEEQQRKAREKQQQQQMLRKQKEEQDARTLDAVMDLAQLKQLKKETIQKLNAQEAAARILGTVVTNAKAAGSGSGSGGQKKKAKGSSKRRSPSSSSSSSSASSSSSSSSSGASKKEKSRKKRKDKKRKTRRHPSSSSS
uniref:peptidylprolyl isomerase n=1 Tax=Anopheles epiroticus TaxID=199890 RepID=A0A182P6L9_9DIPT